MTYRSTSVAMSAATANELRSHVDRPDGQEDICLCTYRPSTGSTRTTALLTSVITPEPGERHVHGNASIEGDYVLRAAIVAHERGDGLALCHSHPGARGWQSMSAPDFDAESSYANLVRELTGHPLVGITYAGSDHSWSAAPLGPRHRAKRLTHALRKRASTRRPPRRLMEQRARARHHGHPNATPLDFVLGCGDPKQLCPPQGARGRCRQCRP